MSRAIRRYAGDFDAARARERERYAASSPTVVMEHCSMCNALVVAGKGFCAGCLKSINEGWPEDEVTAVVRRP